MMLTRVVSPALMRTAGLVIGLFAFGRVAATSASTGDDFRQLVDPGWDRADHFYTPTIAVSADRRVMALAGSRGLAGRLHIWDLETGKRTRLLQGFTRIMVAAFSADGRFLVTGHNPGLLTVWNVTTGVAERRIPFPNETWIRALAFSNDGRSLAVGGQSGTLYSLNYPTLDETWRTHAHHYGLSDIAFTKDAAVIYTAGDDQHIYLWNARTGQANLPLPELRREGGRLKAHTGMIKTIALVDDDRKVVSGSYWEGGNVKSYTSVAPPDEIVRLWDSASGQVLESFQLNWGTRCCIQRLDRGRRVAFVNTAGWGELDGAEKITLRILDLDARKVVQALTDATPVVDPNLHGVQQFRVVPQSDVIVVGLRSGQFLLWNAVSNTVTAAFVSNDDWWAIATPDGRFDVSVLSRISLEPALAFLKTAPYRQVPGLLNRLLFGDAR